MTTPAPLSIKRMKVRLQKISDNHPDAATRRIAQAMRTTLVWATEPTRGWNLAGEPALIAECLKKDLK